MNNCEDLSKTVHDTGRRMTQQRRVILETLRSVSCHPTAGELHDMVREKIADISRGTVYRNLRVLGQLGFVREIQMAGEPVRYDANVESHPHARCEVCGCVVDVPVQTEIGVDGAAEVLDGWELTGYCLQFRGVCGDCANTESNDREDTD